MGEGEDWIGTSTSTIVVAIFTSTLAVGLFRRCRLSDDQSPDVAQELLWLQDSRRSHNVMAKCASVSISELD